MSEDPQAASRFDNKRKYDEPAAAAPRRPTGFSAPISSSTSDDKGPTPPSYNNVPPPVDEIQLAKQRAQEIAARLFSDAEAKRPRVDNGGATENVIDIPFKPLGQQIPNSVVGNSPTFPSYGYQSSTKRIDIPNGRVGVIIGKGGETIKYLQLQSGAKIQVTRDMDADPGSDTRGVELSGTAEQISKAEQLIKDVLEQAEAGGPAVVAAKNLVASQPGTEHFTMKIPNSKVGLIIGKGGETIKNMQARSGTHMQIVPLHLPPGDPSMERTLHIDGTKEQIESAKQLVDEILNSEVRRSGYRPPRPQAWAPPGPPQMQQPNYGYMQPGTYPGAPTQYNMSQPPYGAYPPQQPSAGYSTGWDQAGSTPSQQAAPGTGYDYYNQQAQSQQQPSSAATAPDNSSYNYAQTQATNYGQGSYGDAYSQQAVSQQQGYGQDGSYSGGYGAPPQAGYYQPPVNTQTGYEQQQAYGSAPYGTASGTSQDGSAAASYGAPPQVPPPGNQGPPPTQPAASQSGYTATQTGSATNPGYPQGTQPGYGPPPTSQPAYGGTQAPASGGYAQPTYGQPSPGYGQPPQYGNTQPSPGPSYGGAPPSSYAPGAPQPGYGQQVPYGNPPPPAPGQAGGYGQPSQQPYGGDGSSGGYSQPTSGGYSQPPAYPGTDNAAVGGYSQPPAYATADTAAAGVSNAAPASQVSSAVNSSAQDQSS